MRKKVVLFWLLLGLSIIMIFVGYVFDRNSKPNAQPHDSNAQPYIEVSIDDEESALVGPLVEEWIKWEVSAQDIYNEYHSHGRIYGARSIGLQWGVFDIPQGSFIRKQYFELATKPDFEDARRYEMRAGERSLELYHLLVDQEYYFRITLELENNQNCVEEGRFHTKWSPRIIDLEDLRNIRDVGGWKTTDGKTVRQTLLYRGCELDGATTRNCVITEPSVDIMVGDMGIKTELDLRSSDTNGVKDMLGKSVQHRYIALPSYAECFTDASNQKLRLVFAELANENNYPIYLHCTNGSSRTGIVCYLLEALLGVSEADCYREWELSVLSNGVSGYDEMERFVKKLQAVEGNTLQEKTENYLLAIGVTSQEIENIKTIMLQDSGQ